MHNISQVAFEWKKEKNQRIFDYQSIQLTFCRKKWEKVWRIDTTSFSVNVLSSPYDHTLCPNKLASSFRVILPSIKLIIKMYYAWLVHNFSKDYWYFKDSKTGYRINALDLSGFFGPKLISDANKWEFFNQSSKVIRKWISSETDEDDLKWLCRLVFFFMTLIFRCLARRFFRTK